MNGNAQKFNQHRIVGNRGGLHLDPRFGRGGLVNPDPETRAEAVRHLVKLGAQHSGKAALKKFLEFRIPEATGESMSSREIDELLYGDR